MEPFYIVLHTFGGLIGESELFRFGTEAEAEAWVLGQDPPADDEYEYAIFSYNPTINAFGLINTYTESDMHLWNEEDE